MDKKNIEKIVTVVIAVALIIVIAGGATFAYWQWTADTGQQTLVNVTVEEGITMIITPTSSSAVGLRPTNDCDSAGDALGVGHIKGTAVVSINNQTGILARPSFVLKGKVVKGGSGALDDSDLSHINYAVFDGEVNTCNLASALHTGTFKGVATNGDWTDLQYVASKETSGANGDDLNNSSATTSQFLNNTTFDAPAYTANATHTYTVYVWIDPDYTHTNVGTTVSDPLQNATISITWSGSSIVEQVLTS